MRIFLLAMFCTALFGLGGCASQKPAPPPIIESVTLLDVQPLSGGTNVWFSSDGAIVVEQTALRVNGSGLQAWHYRANLGPERFDQLQRLIDRREFFRLKKSQTPGEPDEAHPEIYLVLKGGGHFCAAEWESQTSARFDPVYQAIENVITEVTGAAAYEQKPYAWNWHPPGYPPPAQMIKCAE